MLQSFGLREVEFEAGNDLKKYLKVITYIEASMHWKKENNEGNKKKKEVHYNSDRIIPVIEIKINLSKSSMSLYKIFYILNEPSLVHKGNV